MHGVLDTLLDKLKKVTQLEREIFIYKNEKTCLESLLDEWYVEIGNL